MLKKKPAQTPEQKALAKNFARAMEESGTAPKAIAEARDISEQAVSNWKRTGKIAREHLPAIAALTGWSVERLLSPDGEGAPAQKAINQVTEVVHTERQVSESQWQMLQDFELLIDEDKHAIRATLHEKAAQVRKAFERLKEQYGIKDTVPNARIEATYGAPPPPPTGAGSYKKITPVPTPASRKHKVK